MAAGKIFKPPVCSRPGCGRDITFGHSRWGLCAHCTDIAEVVVHMLQLMGSAKVGQAPAKVPATVIAPEIKKEG